MINLPNEERKWKIPKNVNSEENSRVKASMVDNLRLTHLQSLRHPTQESKISSKIKVDNFANEIPTPPWATSFAINIPFRKVNSVIDGLNPQQSKGQQECKSSQYVD